ncbi:MAG: SIMPL domain-containing protein [Patescibacteria group bacterium]
MMFIIALASIALAFAGDWFDLGKNRSITVSGTGIAYSAPDVAKIDFGVRSTAKDLATSQKLNADAIAKIKTDLIPFDIKSEDIQTINYNINPDYIYSAYQKPVLSGYTTYHFLRLTMRSLDTVDAILQTLGNSGITDISQISFTIEDPAEVKNEAREKAILAAKNMATQLANLNGATLGKILSIQEETTPTTDNVSQILDGMGGGGSSPGVESGSLSVTSNVTLIYSLK